jgi:acyl carrier protein
LDCNRQRKASVMQELTPKIVTILRRYMANPAAGVGSRTLLSELAIDQLDLPMIFLDIEDTFGVQIDFQDGLEGLATIRCLVSCVASSVAAKALEAQMRKSAPRKKTSWMSTGAASRPASSRA